MCLDAVHASSDQVPVATKARGDPSDVSCGDCAAGMAVGFKWRGKRGALIHRANVIEISMALVAAEIDHVQDAFVVDHLSPEATSFDGRPWVVEQ